MTAKNIKKLILWDGITNLDICESEKYVSLKFATKCLHKILIYKRFPKKILDLISINSF